MKRFFPWLLPIVALLIAIPVLLMVKVTAVAKIAGGAMVVLTSVAVRFWVYRANKYRIRGVKVKFTVNELYFLDGHFPLYKGMSGSDKKALEERVGLLLAEISFDRFDHKDAGKEECLAFAVVLSQVVSGLPYHSCVNKIVVFKDGNVPEMTFQGENAVLFIDEMQLKGILSSFSVQHPSGTIPSETAELLVRFYNHPQ